MERNTGKADMSPMPLAAVSVDSTRKYAWRIRMKGFSGTVIR